MIKKEGTKHCSFCLKQINLKKDKFVLVGAYNRVEKPNDEAYFHFQCWVDFFNQRVLQKTRANIQFMQQKAMALFNNPMIKSMLSQIGGSDQLFSMLSTPLQEQEKTDPVLIKKVLEKINNDTKQKRNAKKRKASLHKM